jgi:uncharacterized membrane protein YgcG
MIRLIIQKLKQLTVYSLAGLAVALPLSTVSAFAASFQLSPGSGTYKVGDYLTIDATEDSGSTGVNFVELDLTYDNSVLNFVSIDASQSDFPAEIPPTAGGGTVQIARAILGNGDGAPAVLLTGVHEVASITFKIVGAASHSSVNLASTSSIKAPSGTTSVSEAWNGVTTGVSFTFTTTAGRGTTGSGGTTGGGTTGGASSGSSSGSGGSSSAGGKSTGSSSKAAAPSAGSSSSPPQNSTTVPVTTSDDSQPQQLIPTTHLVTIKVVDSSNNPLVDAEVKLNGQTTHTLSNGMASFVGVPEGIYKVSVKHKGKTVTTSITVKSQAQGVNNVQSFKVKLTSSKKLPAWLIYSIIGLIVIFIAGLFIPRSRHRRFEYANTVVDTSSIVVGGTDQVKDVVPPPAPAPTSTSTPPSPPPEGSPPPSNNKEQ